jgi:hypothetical protein
VPGATAAITGSETLVDAQTYHAWTAFNVVTPELPNLYASECETEDESKHNGAQVGMKISG